MSCDGTLKLSVRFWLNHVQQHQLLTRMHSVFYCLFDMWYLVGAMTFRGVSSTVRRCYEKATHKEYAVKIIDLTQEKDNEELTEQFRLETKKEMCILRMCAAHPHISRSFISCYNSWSFNMVRLATASLKYWLIEVVQYLNTFMVVHQMHMMDSIGSNALNAGNLEIRYF